MAIAFIAGSANAGTATGAGTTVAAAISASYSAGDLLVAVGTHDLTTNATGDVSSVTDSAGNAWSQGCHIKTAGFGVFVIYWAIAKAGAAANANTVTLNLTLQNDRDIIVGAYTGFPHQPLLVAHATATGNSATASASVTNNYASNALVVAGAGVATAVTGVGGGATNRLTDTFGDNLEDIIGAATGTVTPTATLTSGLWNFGVVLFVPAPYGYEGKPYDGILPPKRPKPDTRFSEDVSILSRITAAALSSLGFIGSEVTPPRRLPPPVDAHPPATKTSTTALGSIAWISDDDRIRARNRAPVEPQGIGGGGVDLMDIGWIPDEPLRTTRPRPPVEPDLFSNATRPLPHLGWVPSEVETRGAGRKPWPEDPALEQRLAGLGPMGWAPVEIEARARGRFAWPEDPAFSATKPLLSLGWVSVEVDPRGKGRLPWPEDPSVVKATSPITLHSIAAWAPDDPLPRARERRVPDPDSNLTATKPLPTLGWAEVEPPRRARTPLPWPDETPIEKLRVTLAGMAWAVDEPPRRSQARLPIEEPFMQGARALSSIGWAEVEVALRRDRRAPPIEEALRARVAPLSGLGWVPVEAPRRSLVRPPIVEDAPTSATVVVHLLSIGWAPVDVEPRGKGRYPWPEAEPAYMLAMETPEIRFDLDDFPLLKFELDDA